MKAHLRNLLYLGVVVATSVALAACGTGSGEVSSVTTSAGGTSTTQGTSGTTTTTTVEGPRFPPCDPKALPAAVTSEGAGNAASPPDPTWYTVTNVVTGTAMPGEINATYPYFAHFVMAPTGAGTTNGFGPEAGTANSQPGSPQVASDGEWAVQDVGGANAGCTTTPSSLWSKFGMQCP